MMNCIAFPKQKSRKQSSKRTIEANNPTNNQSKQSYTNPLKHNACHESPHHDTPIPRIFHERATCGRRSHNICGMRCRMHRCWWHGHRYSGRWTTGLCRSRCVLHSGVLPATLLGSLSLKQRAYAQRSALKYTNVFFVLESKDSYEMKADR